MDKETLKNKKLTRLEDLEVNEVSVVNKAANQKKFLIVKSAEETGDGNMKDQKTQEQIDAAEAAADAEFDAAFKDGVVEVKKGAEAESFEEPIEPTPAAETTPAAEEPAAATAETQPAVEPVVEVPAPAAQPEPVQKAAEVTPVVAGVTPEQLATVRDEIRKEFETALEPVFGALEKLAGQVVAIAKSVKDERAETSKVREELTKAKGELTKIQKAAAAVPASRPVEGSFRKPLEKDQSAEWDVDMARPLRRDGVKKAASPEIDFGKDSFED